MTNFDVQARIHLEISPTFKKRAETHFFKIIGTLNPVDFLKLRTERLLNY